MRSLQFTFLAVILLAWHLPAGRSAPADPFVGAFKGEEITITIKKAAAKYEGTITFEGTVLPFSAALQGDGLTGTFKSEGADYEFSASVDGKYLKLSTAGTGYLLVRQEAPAGEKPANPLAKPKPSANATKPAAAVPAKPDAASPQKTPWKVLRHPVGIAVQYPPTWTMKHLQDAAYQMIPPGVVQDAGQPTEAYFLFGQAAPGIERPDDPQVVQYLEMQVAQLAPFLQRVGEAEAVKTNGQPGAVLLWEGQNGAGKAVRARIYVALVKGFGVGILSLGYKERLDAREKDVRAVFATVTASQEERDPKAAGSWVWVATRDYSAKNSMQSTSGAGESRASLALQPDGTATRRETSQFMASASFKNSLGESTGTLHLDTGPTTTIRKGRWYAGQGRLALLWDNDTAEEFSYQVQAGAGATQLILAADKGRSEVWQRVGGAAQE